MYDTDKIRLNIFFSRRSRVVIGNILFKAINKHSFHWQVVPSNREGEKSNLIRKSACNAHMHKSILKQAWVMDSSAETQKNPF